MDKFNFSFRSRGAWERGYTYNIMVALRLIPSPKEESLGMRLVGSGKDKRLVVYMRLNSQTKQCSSQADLSELVQLSNLLIKRLWIFLIVSTDHLQKRETQLK